MSDGFFAIMQPTIRLPNNLKMELSCSQYLSSQSRLSSKGVKTPKNRFMYSVSSLPPEQKP
uniref:Uncharacterized protein n=1 Tax=Romanomermis culicivorax TaxID=13658 RepID=A0A915K6V2_ROMCU